MKKYISILATILLLTLGSNVAFAGPTADTYQSSPSMQQQQSTYAPPSDTSTSTTSTEKNASDVSIKNFAFMPATITVPMGTTVTWTNNDSTAHTVTGNTTGGPSSGTLQPGQSYSFTFANAGTFPYHCSIHPMMKGTVVVTETSNPSTTPQNTTPSSSPPAPATTTPTTPAATSRTPTSLPNTGAGSVLLVFGAAMVAGTIGYTLYLLRKAPLR